MKQDELTQELQKENDLEVFFLMRTSKLEEQKAREFLSLDHINEQYNQIELFELFRINKGEH
jgi:hypothetical protein